MATHQASPAAGHAAQTLTIVGAAMAGLRTAEALRNDGYSGRIVLFGEEPHLPYSRPPLSKKLLAQAPHHEDVAFRLRPNVADVQWRLGERVVHADLTAGTLETAAGLRESFDALVAASGVRPRRLPVPGPLEGRYVLRSLEDAGRLHQKLMPGTRVLVIGAGFIGCEVAATATALGCDVTVVAADPEPMVRPLGEQVGAAIRYRHEQRGIRFHLGVGIKKFLGDDRATGLELADGTEIPADVIVEAIGSACNTEWLEGNGLDLRDGVLTDENLRVDHSRPVVAAGDVARFPNLLFDGTARRIEHWQLATDTGKSAAATLLAELGGEGAPEPCRPLPYFWSDQHDLRLQSFGAPNLADRIEVLEGELETDCAIGYFNTGRLVGAVLFGLGGRAAHYRSEILAASTTSAAALR